MSIGLPLHSELAGIGSLECRGIFVLLVTLAVRFLLLVRLGRNCFCVHMSVVRDGDVLSYIIGTVLHISQPNLAEFLPRTKGFVRFRPNFVQVRLFRLFRPTFPDLRLFRLFRPTFPDLRPWTKCSIASANLLLQCHVTDEAISSEPNDQIIKNPVNKPFPGIRKKKPHAFTLRFLFYHLEGDVVAEKERFEIPSPI